MIGTGYSCSSLDSAAQEKLWTSSDTPGDWGVRACMHSFSHSFVPSDANPTPSFRPDLQEALDLPEAWPAGLRASEPHFLCQPRR